jgi:hypothetical protein
LAREELFISPGALTSLPILGKIEVSFGFAKTVYEKNLALGIRSLCSGSNPRK